MKIEIDDEEAEKIFVNMIDDHIEWLSKAYRSGDQRVFSHDSMEERGKLAKYIKAAKRTRSMFVTVDQL